MSAFHLSTAADRPRLERQVLALLRPTLNGEFGAKSGRSPNGQDAPLAALHNYANLAPADNIYPDQDAAGFAQFVGQNDW
jgi:hypothetical protein